MVLLRTASAVPSTEVMPVIVATGSRRTPVLNGPYSFRNWKESVTRKMNPISEKQVIVTAPLAAVKRRFRNSRMSSIGAAARRSQSTKASRREAASAKPARLRTEVQPCLGIVAYLVLAVVLLKDAPRERLIERFARGEITEDFLERRAVFGGSTPGAAGDDSH